MNEETNKNTMKEKIKKFKDDYGIVLPACIGLTALNTLALIKINKKVKSQGSAMKNLQFDIKDLTMSMADQHCEIMTIHKAINK